MRYIAGSAIVALLLCGCATVPREDPVEAAAEKAWVQSLHNAKDGFGAYPEDYEKIIKEYMADKLKDPESARYSNFRPLMKDLKIVDMKKRIALLGYSTCVDINAKNSYGGYTGAKRHWFLIKDGKIVDSLDPELGDPAFEGVMAQLIELNCKTPNIKQ